ncbi:MAG: nitrilase-related carbon-nitrogen hydrolase [Steroidobacteraceae bacterium]
MTIKPWRAASVQMHSNLAVTTPDRTAAWAVIDENLERCIALIESANRQADPPRLYVCPEFAFQGAPHDMPVQQWIDKACCPVPGPITAPLQSLARRHALYIAGNQFETSDEWPGRYFNTSFLIGPSGDIILRYRRITTAAFPSPHDFMDDYLRRTPRDSVFPVVDTELGRLSMIPCSEISVPEVARVMMMQGAEVILHPTNGKRSHAEDAAKIARCAENKMYLISANVAGPIGFSIDRKELGGRSRIIDHTGALLAYHEEADESTAVQAMIDIRALRQDRGEDDGPSSLLRARWEMYRPYFNAACFYPANGFLRAPMQDVAETEQLLQMARTNMVNAGMPL